MITVESERDPTSVESTIKWGATLVITSNPSSELGTEELIALTETDGNVIVALMIASHLAILFCKKRRKS